MRQCRDGAIFLPMLSRALDPAVGFIALGMFEDAWEMLEALPAELKVTEPVLALRYEILSDLGKWETARMIGESMASKVPENPDWWWRWAFALRREKSVHEARHVLWQAVQLHPGVAIIQYNLACYACVLGELEDAKRLLERAFALDPSFRPAALDDPDLDPIWGGM